MGEAEVEKGGATAGDRLFVSIITVRKHIRSIYEKLQVHTKSQAVQKALRAASSERSLATALTEHAPRWRFSLTDGKAGAASPEPP